METLKEVDNEEETKGKNKNSREDDSVHEYEDFG